MTDFLNSKPDIYSPLNGRELIAKKVKILVDMGGIFGQIDAWGATQKPGICADCMGEFNIQQCTNCAQDVVANWPTPIMFSGFEIGWPLACDGVLTTGPAKEIVGGSRPAWDQTAIFFAARGLVNYWDGALSGSVTFSNDSKTAWSATPDKRQGYLKKKMENGALDAVMSEVMAKAGKGCACRDSVVPSIPANFTAQPLPDGSVLLSWDASLSTPNAIVSSYAIYRDGAQLDPDAYGGAFLDKGTQEASSYTYEIRASTNTGVVSEKSAPLAVAVPPDKTVPTIKSAICLTNNSSVEVVFSKPVEKNSAESAQNYKIDNGISVSAAAVQTGGSILLSVTPGLTATSSYQLTVNGVRDLARTPNTAVNESAEILFCFGKVFEAENGTTNGDTRTGANSSGGKFDGALGDIGVYVDFTVNVPTTGLYDLSIRYISDEPTTRSIYVNGTHAGDALLTPLTITYGGDWNQAGTTSPVTISLNAGNSKVRIIRDADDRGNLDMDYIKIETSKNQMPSITKVDNSLPLPSEKRFVLHMSDASAIGLNGYSKNEIISITIVDVAGRSIVRQTLKTGISGTARFSLQKGPLLKAGCYLLMIRSNSMAQTYKLVKHDR
jgi:hypothetical protein